MMWFSGSGNWSCGIRYLHCVETSVQIAGIMVLPKKCPWVMTTSYMSSYLNDNVPDQTGTCFALFSRHCSLLLQKTKPEEIYLCMRNVAFLDSLPWRVWQHLSFTRGCLPCSTEVRKAVALPRTT